MDPMANPTILTVDDDPAVSRAVARDIRRQYGDRYRILRALSGREALEALREIKLRGDQLALMLADYRMPQMNGIEFLEAAMDLFPLARRVLLDRLRRHGRGHRRDQRRRPRPLPPQAVEPAGGEPLPGDRHAAGRCGSPRPTRTASETARGRAPLVGALLQGARLPHPQPGAVPVAARRRARGPSGC